MRSFVFVVAEIGARGREGLQGLWQACFLSVLAMRGIKPRVGNARTNQKQFTHFVYALEFKLLYVKELRS